MAAQPVDGGWTIRAALDWCAGYLEGKGDEHPRLSAEWLLSAATGLSRIELYAYHDRPLTPEERATLREAVKRRSEGAPLQYITGEVAFRHLVLKVTGGVLIPRPETEVLVGEAIAAIEGIASPLVADICTGSGCVALSIAQECPTVVVHATDLSESAVGLAAENAERLNLSDRVAVHFGDLFEALPEGLLGKFDCIVANPPYVPTADIDSLPTEVSEFEPRLALDGGEDGLDVFRGLLSGSVEWLREGGALVVELDERRVQTAAEEALLWYQEVRTVQDLAGRDRVVAAFRQRQQS